MRVLVRWAPWIPLGVFGALVVVVGALAMRGTIVSDTLGILVLPASFVMGGALMAAQRPRNAMGWLCLGFGSAAGGQR
jgi:hypothetical protein